MSVGVRADVVKSIKIVDCDSTTREGSILIVRPSINEPFVIETQDKPKNIFFADHLEAFKQSHIQSLASHSLRIS